MGITCRSSLSKKSYNVVCIESNSDIDNCNKCDADQLISRVKPDQLYQLAHFYCTSEDHKLISDLEKLETSFAFDDLYFGRN